MSFAPQRHALFRHPNLQKWSEPLVFCTFWLANVLRATTVCTFSTSQLPEVLRAPGVLYILTWKCASRHNGVQFFISPLASWLRTLSEPTFRPSGATNQWKNTVNRDFPTFSRISIFFLLTLSLLLFSLLIFLFSLPLPCSAFHLSILSEVWLLNFLRSKYEKMDQNVTKCNKVYQNVTNCDKVYQNVTKWNKLNVTNWMKIDQNVTKCNQSVTKCDKMYQNVSKSSKMWQNVTKCIKSIQLYQNVSKCDTVQRNVTKCIKNVSVVHGSLTRKSRSASPGCKDWPLQGWHALISRSFDFWLKKNIALGGLHFSPFSTLGYEPKKLNSG